MKGRKRFDLGCRVEVKGEGHREGVVEVGCTPVREGAFSDEVAGCRQWSLLFGSVSGFGSRRRRLSLLVGLARDVHGVKASSSVATGLFVARHLTDMMTELGREHGEPTSLDVEQLFLRLARPEGILGDGVRLVESIGEEAVERGGIHPVGLW